jgi:protein-tyrosine-phosphatase
MAVAGSFSTDLSSHRSTVLEREQLLDTDIVVVFDKVIRSALLEQYGVGRRQLIEFGLLAAVGADIRDPFGAEVDVFEEVYGTIYAILRSVKARYPS